jgi:tetratricopeptide (TPR) repeat protein
MDWWTQNKDAITAISATIAAIITVGGIIWAIFKWGISRWQSRRIRIDVKVFEVITNPSVLLPKLYATENDDSPLADHNIKYQPRDPDQDLQAELKAALHRSRYLLVTAPTGYGKTREAGMLAQTMMLEGWRVLRIRTGWLDVPKTLPEELNGNRSRILILLDDLNGLFGVGEKTQSPRVENEKTLMLSQLSYHDRLLQMLDMFEDMCTESEIRVIATARSEAEQWKVLDFNQKDRLWKRFERIEISEPVDTAIINLLEETTKQADLKADESEFKAIAHKSDGTYRNILLNLRRYRSQNKPVSKDDFTDTLDGSWKDIYDRAVKKKPAVKYIYDAVDVLKQAGIELFPFLIVPTALMIWGGNYFQKILRERRIKSALHYLTRETKIFRLEKGELSPSDGQIESKGNLQDWNRFLPELEELLLSTSNQFGKMLLNSLTGFGVELAQSNHLEKAIKLWQRGAEISPEWFFWYNQGVAFTDLKRYDETEAAYRKAIELNPSEATPYYNLGCLLDDLKRYDEAEAAYRKAIELNPSYATAYSNLGILLKTLKRYDEAEAAYRKAIELNPSEAPPYYNLGSLLDDLKRYDEAEAAYRKAIKLNPSDATTYNNLAIMLRVTGRVKDALPLLEKLIEIDPEDFNSYLGVASIKKMLGESIELSFIEKARRYIPEDDFYNRACLESVSDNFELAFEYLRKATQNEIFNSSWAWEDPDLQWIRDDPRFIDIVGPKPKNKNSEN